jgi:hypothetical protein
MVYDEATTERFRRALAALGHQLDERRMMGGLCFMLAGNMLGGAHREKTGERLFMFRVGPDAHDWALSQPNTRPVQFGDRMPMRGLVFVEADACDDKQLDRWVREALQFAEGLPPKG